MADQARPLGDTRQIVAADGRRYAFADHNCFACGGSNPIGMRLHIELLEGAARSSWRAGEDFVGWSDKLHGGIVATMLDEVMAWACASFDAWAVTAEMNIRYRSPASPGDELEADARVVRKRRRIYESRAACAPPMGGSSPRGAAATWERRHRPRSSSSSATARRLAWAPNDDKRDTPVSEVRGTDRWR